MKDLGVPQVQETSIYALSIFISDCVHGCWIFPTANVRRQIFWVSGPSLCHTDRAKETSQGEEWMAQCDFPGNLHTAWDIPLLSCVRVATGHSFGGCSAIFSPLFAWTYQFVTTRCTPRNEGGQCNEDKTINTEPFKSIGVGHRMKQMAKWRPMHRKSEPTVASYGTQTDMSADALPKIVTIASTKTTGPRPRSSRCPGFSGFGGVWCVSTHHAQNVWHKLA